MAMDPVKGQIVEPLSLVPYVYCVDNPLRWVDPLGLRLEHLDDLGGGGKIQKRLKPGQIVTAKKPDPGIGHTVAKAVSKGYKEYTSVIAKTSSSISNGLNKAESGLQKAETTLRVIETISIFGEQVEVVAVVEPIANFVGETHVIVSNLNSGVQALDALIQINNNGANKAYVAILNEDYSGALKAYWDVIPQGTMALLDCAKEEIIKVAMESFLGHVLQKLTDALNSSVSEPLPTQSTANENTSPNGSIHGGRESLGDICQERGGCPGSTQFDLNRLTRSQRRAIDKAENIINHSLKESDLSGALGDLNGQPIIKADGTSWNHKKEVQEAYAGLSKELRSLTGSLQNPNLDPNVREFIESECARIKSYMERVEEIFAPYGGI